MTWHHHYNNSTGSVDSFLTRTLATGEVVTAGRATLTIAEFKFVTGRMALGADAFRLACLDVRALREALAHEGLPVNIRVIFEQVNRVAIRGAGAAAEDVVLVADEGLWAFLVRGGEAVTAAVIELTRFADLLI